MVIWVNHTRHERKMSGPRVYFQGICLVFAKGEYLMPNKDQKIFNDWIKTFRLINTILFWHENIKHRQIYLIGLTIKISSLTNYNGLNHRQTITAKQSHNFPTVSTAFISGVLQSSSGLIQFGCALLARASSITGRFRAWAALYSSMFGSNLLMSSHDVVDLESSVSSDPDSPELSRSIPE